MSRRAAAALFLALLLVGGSEPPAAAAAQDAGERARAGLAEQLAAAGAPGAAVAVVDTRGQTAAYGLGSTGDGRAVTAQTPFVIGSTSKSVTALAVMQLVDAGLVDLDAPVRRYVPELRLADQSAADAITVRHVLQQTSGLAGTVGGTVLKAARQGSALDAVAELRDTRLISTPGRVWHYSNANYVLAGLVVERASGMSYADYVERRIFAPLGMTGSSTDLADARRDGVTPGHRRWFGATVSSGPALPPGLLAAGFLVSTAQDMGRYLGMYLRDGLAEDGTRVVSAQGLTTMTTPGPTAHLGTWADGASARYAMGWFVGGPWTEPALLHPGNSPDSSAMITVLPDRGLAVATMVNLSHELPVPGNPSATDRLTRNVVDAALGGSAVTAASTTRFYLWFDLACLALVAAAGWGLIRATAALRAGRRPRHRLGAAAGVVVRLALAASLLALPRSVGYGWPALWVWAPDLTLVLGVLVAVILPTALLRLALIRGGSHDSDDAPKPGGAGRRGRARTVLA